MPESPVVDSGLGLSEFLAPKAAPPPEGKEPSPEAEKVEVVKTKPEEKTVEAPAKAPEKKKEEPKLEAKEPPKEEKPKFDWESEDNPYKKRQHDTFRWANQVNQQNGELKKQLELINKKLDGTYDPEKDTPQPPDVNEVAAIAQVRGRAEASKQLAIEMAAKDGKDEAWVNSQIREFDRTLGANPIVQARVYASPSPVVEALKIMREQAFVKHWGSDVSQIEEKIRADERGKMESKIEELVNKRIEERLNKRDRQPTGVRDARQAPVEDSAYRPKSLEEILAH